MIIVQPAAVEDEPEELPDMSAENVAPQPPPTAEPTETRTPTRPAELMMTSLKNSNKRKGFKERQAGRRPEKIVFDGAENVNANATSTASASFSRPNSRASISHLPRLIPPSERTDLPSNVFVTSVDVEADLWTEKGKGAKKRNYAGNGGYEYHGRAQDYRMGYLDPSTYFESRKGGDEEGHVELDYGEPEGFPAAGVNNKRSSTSRSTSSDGIDWVEAESNWDKYAKVEDPSSLTPGTTVAWQVRTPTSEMSVLNKISSLRPC